MTLLSIFVAAALAGYGIVPDGLYVFDAAKYVRTADCHLTDSVVTESFAGSLAPGQGFSTFLDLCYPDQYTTLPGYVDEQTDEDFALAVSARGDLEVGLTLQRRDYPDRSLPVVETAGKPTNSWVGCAYPSYWTTYDATNTAQLGGARLLVSLVNRTSHVVRSIALTLYLNLNTTWFEAQHGCAR